MTIEHTRRQALRLGGIGLTIGLAGCGDIEDDNGNGLEQVVSEDGSVISVDVADESSTTASGTDAGEVWIFDDGEEVLRSSYEDFGTPPEVSLSSDGETALATFPDSDGFGLVAQNGDLVWGGIFAFPWAFVSAGTPDFSRVAVGARPDNGPGGLTLVEGGEVSWTEEFPESTVYDVSVSVEGEYIAAAAEPYTPDTLEQNPDPTGQSVVHLYDDQGNALWRNSVTEPPISVHVRTESEIVVAGLDDGSLRVFNLNGDLLWESDAGGFTDVSDDGDTIVCLSDNLEETVAFDSGGDEKWRQESGYGLLGPNQITVSGTGERAILSYNNPLEDPETKVVLHGPEGEPVWEEEYDSLTRVDCDATGERWAIGSQEEFEVYQE